jgi:hypothetical protein
MSNELAVVDPKELYRISTDVAGLCKEAVVKTSLKISGKNYVKVEGWQTIGAAHGCLAEIESVEEAEIEGVRGLICWSRLKRISDQAVISRASAFLGDDESQEGISGKKYARYAKVQTRAMSRVLSNAFRFVVVLMNAGLETTPAEEIPREGFANSDPAPQAPVETQVLEGQITEIYVNKEWTYATVKGIKFSTKRDELRVQLAKIDEGALVRVTVNKMIVAGGKVKFRPVTIEVLSSPTQSETEENGEQE